MTRSATPSQQASESSEVTFMPADKIDAYKTNLLNTWPLEQLLAVNLQALSQKNPLLADQIQKTPVPDSIELTVANDGQITFIQKLPDNRIQWFGSSSIPGVFAEQNIERIDVDQINLALNGIWQGADVMAILKKMNPNQALFIFERDLLNLRLAFCLYDFSLHLVNGNLVIFVGEDYEKQLIEFYDENSGYTILERVVSLPYCEDKENQIFSLQITTVMQNQLQAIFKKIASLGKELSEAYEQRPLIQCLETLKSQNWDECGILNVARFYNEHEYFLSLHLLTGMMQQGLVVDQMVCDQPGKASVIPQLEKLLSNLPQMVILKENYRKDFSYAIPENVVCLTCLDYVDEQVLENQEPVSQRIKPQDMLIVTSQEDKETLVKFDVPDEQVLNVKITANTELYQPVELETNDLKYYGSDVALVSDRFSSDPEDYGIRLPTHQKLLDVVIHEICDASEKYEYEKARLFLKRAQRCGVQLKEKDIEEHFVKLVREFYGEIILRDLYAASLIQKEIDLKIWYTESVHPLMANPNTNFWHQSNVNDFVAGGVSEGEALNKLYNAAKIYLYINSQGLVNKRLIDGIAAGAFFLVKAHSKSDHSNSLMNYFKPGKEIIVFDTIEDLQRKVKYYLKHEDERIKIAQAARLKVLENYSAKNSAGIILDGVEKRLSQIL